MKYFLIFSCLALFRFNAAAQTGSWAIQLNNKTILITKTEEPLKNIRKISKAEWKKNGTLEISFRDDEPLVWWRSFLLNDDMDNELYRKDSVVTIKISLASLRVMFRGKKEIRIYTTIAPRDPRMAIRIRRVHLCTLQLP